MKCTETKSFFVTGTDTASGKTLASTMLLRAFNQAGYPVYGMKPVASGCLRTADGLVSEDALKLMNNSTIKLPYKVINPIALETPCSPNIAAELEGCNLTPQIILDAFRVLQRNKGIIIMEGVGGWCTPVFGLQGMGDIVKQLSLPVLMVVGLRLGCINHAAMTLSAIEKDGVELVGWIANHVDPDYMQSEQTVSCLQDLLGCNLLGHIPFLRDPTIIANLDIQSLLE
jgi:dethiobiotin synthetase